MVATEARPAVITIDTTIISDESHPHERERGSNIIRMGGLELKKEKA